MGTALWKWLGDTRVNLPLILVVAIIVFAYRADDFTIAHLGQFFVTKAQAQAISDRVFNLEGAVDSLGREVGELGKKIDAQRVKTIEQEVFKLVIERCRADGTLRTVLTTQITMLVAEWRTLTDNPIGDPPTLVRCDDVGP